jgi:hypothetical protein
MTMTRGCWAAWGIAAAVALQGCGVLRHGAAATVTYKVTATGDAGVTKLGGVGFRYRAGEATLSAEVEQGKSFKGWYVGDSCYSSEPVWVHQVTQDVAFSVQTGEKKKYRYTVTAAYGVVDVEMFGEVAAAGDTVPIKVEYDKDCFDFWATVDSATGHVIGTTEDYFIMPAHDLTAWSYADTLYMDRKENVTVYVSGEFYALDSITTEIQAPPHTWVRLTKRHREGYVGWGWQPIDLRSKESIFPLMQGNTVDFYTHNYSTWVQRRQSDSHHDRRRTPALHRNGR